MLGGCAAKRINAPQPCTHTEKGSRARGCCTTSIVQPRCQGTQDLDKASRSHEDGPCLSFENAKNMTSHRTNVHDSELSVRLSGLGKTGSDRSFAACLPHLSRPLRKR